MFEISIGGVKGIVAAYPDDTFEKCFKLNHRSDVDLVYRSSMGFGNLIGETWPLEVRGQSRSPPSSHLSWAIIAQLVSLGITYDVRITQLTSRWLF